MKNKLNFMRIKILPQIVVLAILILTVSGCKSAAEKDIPALVNKQIEALNSENIEGYLSTVEPNTPNYETSRTVMQHLFKLYDLEYTMNSFSIKRIEDQEAEVEMTVTVRRISGPAFQDSKSNFSNILKKTPDGWKFSSTKIIKTEFI